LHGAILEGGIEGWLVSRGNGLPMVGGRFDTHCVYIKGVWLKEPQVGLYMELETKAGKVYDKIRVRYLGTGPWGTRERPGEHGGPGPFCNQQESKKNGSFPSGERNVGRLLARDDDAHGQMYK
jgi:hypothetical protein